MRLEQIIEEVEKVFQELDDHLKSTSEESGLRCPDFCGVCCRKADIEASPIEFLPLAAWLYKTDKVNDFLAKLDNPENVWCSCFCADGQQNGEWGCKNYSHRGLICRLFGFGYRLNRNNEPVLVTCRIMKTQFSDAVAKAGVMASQNPESMPIFSQYFMRLLAIDPDLAVPQMPINEAIRKAIEILYFHYLPHED